MKATCVTLAKNTLTNLVLNSGEQNKMATPVTKSDLKFKLQAPNGQEWLSGITLEHVEYQLKRFEEIISNINRNQMEMVSRISSLESARFQLQRAEVEKLIANLKPEMLEFIKKTYPKKAFKEWPIRDEFDKWYGWQACNEAFKQLVAEGKITYKRGWNHLVPDVQIIVKEGSEGKQ
jgi:hypothetical protein